MAKSSNLQGIFDGLDMSSLAMLKKSIDDKNIDEFTSTYKQDWRCWWNKAHSPPEPGGVPSRSEGGAVCSKTNSTD